MVRILISSCLLGEEVRYNGAHARISHPFLTRWYEEERLVPFCPEVSAGLTIPRAPAEIINGDGAAVLENTARVIDNTGKDITRAMLIGAQNTLALARQQAIRIAILMKKSPSCGSGTIYNGTFTGALQQGVGVTAALLMQNGIRVFNQHQVEQAAACLRLLEEALKSAWVL